MNTIYKQEQQTKKLKPRPLFPNLVNKDTKTKYALVYDDCDVLETLEYMVFGIKPIRYPDKTSFFTRCPTCSLRQALEYLALKRIPTDADGEKFNHYDRQYLSQVACEQLDKIHEAIPQLEVLIDKGLVKCTLIDSKNNTVQATGPVEIQLNPNLGEGFTLTCGKKEYCNAIFDFNELEKQFKDYNQPQTVYKLTIDAKGLYLQVNNGEKEQLCRFNYKQKHAPECFNVLQHVMNNPKTPVSPKKFPNIISFASSLNKLFSRPNLRGIKDAFFTIKNGELTFNGDVTNLIRIQD